MVVHGTGFACDEESADEDGCVSGDGDGDGDGSHAHDAVVINRGGGSSVLGLDGEGKAADGDGVDGSGAGGGGGGGDGGRDRGGGGGGGEGGGGGGGDSFGDSGRRSPRVVLVERDSCGLVVLVTERGARLAEAQVDATLRTVTEIGAPAGKRVVQASKAGRLVLCVLEDGAVWLLRLSRARSTLVTKAVPATLPTLVAACIACDFHGTLLGGGQDGGGDGE
eukprot:1795923-Pleurochrysis_carterae.AAC.1